MILLPRSLRLLTGRLLRLLGLLGAPLPAWTRPLLLEAVYGPLWRWLYRGNVLWTRFRGAIPAGRAPGEDPLIHDSPIM